MAQNTMSFIGIPTREQRGLSWKDKTQTTDILSLSQKKHENQAGLEAVGKHVPSI